MQAVTDRQQIGQTYQRFAELICKEGEPFPRTVGYPGGNVQTIVLWHEDLKIWVLLYTRDRHNRYWCAFGLEDPSSASTLSITCEINPPREGVDRKCAGLFVRDESGEFFLAHSGKVGGGRPGIGKSAFLKRWKQLGNDIVSVSFPNSEKSDYIIVGSIADPDFRRNLKKFVHSVGTIKAELAGTV